ncbi:STE3-domain-containing protein [Peniophora sp. CONT]|nr:STE3-domain-containing protein [Peniophora sp. CONT]
MGAVDPTYPLFPIASILAAVLLLIMLLNGLVRQSWNLGLCFLSFWLLVINLINAANAIIWSDNADIKLYVYCNIVTRVQLVIPTVRSSATFIIIRRLHIVASSRSTEPPTKAARRWDLFVEWTAGLAIPLLIAGPFYYVLQGLPFEILEGFGCYNAYVNSVLTYLLILMWPVIFPLISIAFYCPKVAYTFYHHSRDVNRFLRTNTSGVSRTNYIRILFIASIDLFLTLPTSVTDLILSINEDLNYKVPFYPGWDFVHSDWVPHSILYSVLQEAPPALAIQYFDPWMSLILAYSIFCLFGLTAEARASYRRAVCAVWKQVTRRPSPRSTRTLRSPLASMAFQTRPQETSPSVCSISQPGLVDMTFSAAGNGLDSRVGQGCNELPELENNNARQDSTVDEVRNSDLHAHRIV